MAGKVGKLHVDFEARTATFEERTKRARKSMGAFGKEAKGVAGLMGRLKGGIGGVVAPMLAVASAGALMASAFGNVRTSERLEAMLKTATGSASAAAVKMGELRGTAKKLTSGLDEVADSFLKLKNRGLDPSENALISYSNTAAAMGKSLDQMIEAAADAVTGGFVRLEEFGVKGRTEGDKVAFTFQGVTTRVGKNAKEIEDYLLRLGNVNFAGSVADQIDTLDGKLSMLSDSWFSFTTAVAERSGLSDATKWGLDKLTQGFNDLATNVRLAFKDVGEIGLEDMDALESFIERAERGGSATFGDLPAAKARLEALKAEKAELDAIADAKAQAAKTDEQRAALDEWEAKKRLEMMRIDKRYFSESQRLWGDIYRIQEQLSKGEAATAEAGVRELEAKWQEMEKLNAEMREFNEEQEKAARGTKRWANEWTEVSRNMKLAFAEGVAGGQKLGDILEDVARIWTRNAALNLLLGGRSEKTGERSGGVLDTVFGGIGKLFGRATGGSVTAGELYRVNENRREYFRPSVGGTVLPLAPAGGGGDGVTVNIELNANGAGPREIDELRAMVQAIPGMIVPVVRDARARGKL